MRRNCLRERIRERIAASKDDVFFPREFLDLSDEDQVLRALRELMKEKQLVRIGYASMRVLSRRVSPVKPF